MQAVLNRSVRRDSAFRGLFDASEYQQVAGFYSAHRELTATPLRSLPALAARLGVREILIKDESGRWGVEAFKIAGVRFAVEQLDTGTMRRGVTCATAGNHGRAVARAARDLDVPCTVFLPAARTGAHPSERTTRGARVAAMRADGATVIETSQSYEGAVALAAAHGERTGAAVVSDTAWPGYERIPRLIMNGYTRLFDEAAMTWSAPPDVVLVQGGVGGLVCAAANWFAFRFGSARPLMIACEPVEAACLLESSRAGHPIKLSATGSQDERKPPALNTIMAGLRCAAPSPAAWPSIDAGIDAFVAVSDEQALDTMKTLAAPELNDEPIHAGPSGACSAAAMIALAQDAGAADLRRAVRLGPATRLMAIVTEGP
jgi:diaminopropionate ammonia-lyase